MAKVLDLLDWKPSQVTVFGDELNDLGMFKEYYGIAVENARPEILAQAREVIGPHHEDAVARWLAGRFSAHQMV